MFAVFASFPLVLLTAVAVPAQPDCGVEPVAPTAAEAPVLEAYTHRITAYMRVHKDVERALSLQRSFDDAEDLFEALEAMRSGIRARRPTATRGAILTPDMGYLIRARLENRLFACGQKVEDVLAFINEERSPNARSPQINEGFPWELGSAMWPSFMGVLPPLPDELEYRFADRDLVLVDVHADLVVDILVNALPAPSSADDGAYHRL
jgi:hypothetical protein